MFVDFGDVVIDCDRIAYAYSAMGGSGYSRTYFILELRDSNCEHIKIESICDFGKAKDLLTKSNLGYICYRETPVMFDPGSQDFKDVTDGGDES